MTSEIGCEEIARIQQPTLIIFDFAYQSNGSSIDSIGSSTFWPKLRVNRWLTSSTYKLSTKSNRLMARILLLDKNTRGLLNNWWRRFFQIMLTMTLALSASRFIERHSLWQWVFQQFEILFGFPRKTLLNEKTTMTEEKGRRRED